MQRRDPLVSGELYHVYNRGVEKRDIFESQNDYLRFLHSLSEFNSTLSAENIYYREVYEVAPRKNEERLVSILAYTLLPNHFHLLLRQETEHGITEFMRKIGTGYTMYFNKKSARVGPLFQGRFKSSHVGKDEYLQYLPHYIHLNVLDVTAPGWKDAGISHRDAIAKLEAYPWSSAKAYLSGEKNDELVDFALAKELFGFDDHHADSIKEILGDAESRDRLNSYEVAPRKNL